MSQEGVAVEELERSKGKVVLLKLGGGETIRGRLEAVDMHLNITLHDAEEVSGDNKTRPIGTVLVRGDNIIMVSPS